MTQRPANRPRTTRAVAVKKPKGQTITFQGKEYRLAEDIGVWPMMQFARAAEMGESLREQRGMASLHAMLENVIHEDEWPQFQDDMIAMKVKDPSKLMDLATQAIALLRDHLEIADGNGSSPG